MRIETKLHQMTGPAEIGQQASANMQAAMR